MYTWSARACADSTVKTVKSVNSHDGLVLDADMAAILNDSRSKDKDNQVIERQMLRCCQYY